MQQCDLLYSYSIRSVLPTVHPDEAEKRRNETAIIAETSAVNVVLRILYSSIFLSDGHAGRELSSLTVHPSIFHRPSCRTRYQVPSLCWISPVSVAWVSPVTVAVLFEISAFGPSMNTTLSTLSKESSKVARSGNHLCRQSSLRSLADVS